MKTGFIGIGAMGSGMARCVAQTGFLVGVYNRTASKAQTIAEELGVKAFNKPEELTAQVDLLLLCVSTDKDLLEIINTILPVIHTDTIVVDMSTVSSETAKAAANLLTEKQAYFLDAPVSGGVEGAQKGTLSMMVGGNAEVLTRAMPILASMASRIIHMGETGAGQATKAVNQLMAAGINQAVTEALAFAQAQQLPVQKVIEVISAGAAGNWFLQHRGLTMTQDIFKPGFKVKLHHKDLLICQAMANTTQTPSTMLSAILDDYAKLMEQGYGDEDISALFRLKNQA